MYRTIMYLKIFFLIMYYKREVYMITGMHIEIVKKY